MSDAAESVPFEVEQSDPAPTEEKKAKPKKGKKRPSDFEIVRTLLTRMTDRKLPYILKNMGEDSDILLLCSEDESGFLYGSSSMTIALMEFDDPEVQTLVMSLLAKLHGFSSENQIVINLRDQMSELAKTKGEAIDTEVSKSEDGSAWVLKTDVNGKQRTQYYAKAIDSLFHFQMIGTWCKKFGPLLSTQDNVNLYYPYKHPEGKTYTLLTLPVPDDSEHPISSLFPNGFRITVTRGIDVLLSKSLEEFPYPILSEEIIITQDDGCAARMAHRIIGQGWRIVTLRPNAILFPTVKTKLPDTGPTQL